MPTLHANWNCGRLWVWCADDRGDGGAPQPVRPLALVRAAAPFFGGCKRPALRARHVRETRLAGESSGKAFALPLSASEAALLLCRVMKASADGGTALSPLLAMAPDTVFAASLWRFAIAAVAAGRIIPALVGGSSRWDPALCEGERAALDALCRTAPAPFPAIDGASGPHETFGGLLDLAVRLACAPVSKFVFERVSDGNLHSRFLASLARTSGALGWQCEGDTSALSAMLDGWRGRALPGQSGRYRLGFRVLDPVNSDSISPLWRLVPVAISGDSATPVTASFLEGAGDGARAILEAIGHASKFVRELDDLPPAMGGRAIAALLDAAALRAFMDSAVPLLEMSGYPVFAPRWWKPKSLRRPSIRAVSAGFARKEGAFSLDSIVNVQWQVVLEGTGLSVRELKWLAENEVPVANVGGRWMNVDPQQMKEAAKAVEALAGRKTSLRDLVRIGFFQDGIPAEVPDSALTPEMLSLARPFRGAGKVARVRVPRTFNGTLREYQRTGLDWLSYLRKAGFGACLADDMGLGKTVEALAAFLDARRDGVKGPMLLVCPMSIMLKWLHECRRFAPSLDPWIYHGLERPRGDAFRKEALSRGLCITSYQMLGAEMESFSSVRWAVAALDEAQNVKNPSTVKSRSARALDAGWRLAITGTPVENQTTDLWAIMDFANRGLLPARADFERRFGSNSADGAAGESAAALRKLVAPFILRRTKSDPAIAAGLPAKVEEKVFCRLSAEQASLYAAETAAAEKEVAARTGIARRGAVLALITRLKEICDYPGAGDAAEAAGDPLDPERSGKLATLDEMLRQVIDAGEAALVFTQYASFGRLLARHLSARFGCDVPFLHGGVPAAERQAMVARFQDESGPPIFLVSIRAGGIGFNLTRANHVFHYDRWWNPATENQATDRAHRIGQSKTVFVHTFICDGTLESKIDTLITGKMALADKVISSGAGWLAGLDDAALMEIVTLSAGTGL